MSRAESLLGPLNAEQTTEFLFDLMTYATEDATAAAVRRWVSATGYSVALLEEED